MFCMCPLALTGLFGPVAGADSVLWDLWQGESAQVASENFRFIKWPANSGLALQSVLPLAVSLAVSCLAPTCLYVSLRDCNKVSLEHHLHNPMGVARASSPHTITPQAPQSLDLTTDAAPLPFNR